MEISIVKKAHELCLHTIYNKEPPVEVYDYSIIIPYRKRYNNLKITFESIKKSIEYTSKRIHCILFEHSEQPEADVFCKENGIEYIYVPICNLDKNLSQFNRGLAFDMSVVYGLPAKGYVCHDVDIFIPVNFWESLEENCKNQNVKVLQTYANRCVNNMNPESTIKLHNGEVLYTDITAENCLPRSPGSWGGSLYIDRKTYFEIGGHDPDLFSGYAPEDQCIVEKCKLMNFTIGFANSPPIELYHQYHTPTSNTNPYLNYMTNLFHQLKSNEEMFYDYISTKKASIIL